MDLESLKILITEMFKNLNNKLDIFINANKNEHDDLFEKANEVPVLKEQNNNQQKQIDLLFKWVVGAFVTAFGAVLGLLIAIIIFLITK